MDLKTFVSESLEQIVAGIRDAQSKEGGDNVAAEMYGGAVGQLIQGGTSGTFTAVEFDVAVTASTSGAGKAQVAVFGAELGGGAEHKFGRESRLKFTVPVRLPKGGKASR